MSERTTSKTVTFKHEARIDGVEAPIPPGLYVVETDQEQIPGVSFVAYRRLRTLMLVPVLNGAAHTRQLIEIDPTHLQAALDRDDPVG